MLGAAPARAECLGDGCYDGLGLLVLGFAAVVVVTLGATLFAAVKLGKRHGVLAGLGLIAGVLVLGYWVFRGFL